MAPIAQECWSTCNKIQFHTTLTPLHTANFSKSLKRLTLKTWDLSSQYPFPALTAFTASSGVENSRKKYLYQNKRQSTKLTSYPKILSDSYLRMMLSDIQNLPCTPSHLLMGHTPFTSPHLPFEIPLVVNGIILRHNLPKSCENLVEYSLELCHPVRPHLGGVVHNDDILVSSLLHRLLFHQIRSNSSKTNLVFTQAPASLVLPMPYLHWVAKNKTL